MEHVSYVVIFLYIYLCARWTFSSLTSEIGTGGERRSMSEERGERRVKSGLTRKGIEVTKESSHGQSDNIGTC